MRIRMFEEASGGVLSDKPGDLANQKDQQWRRSVAVDHGVH
jgi:hypothetical protein